MTDATTTTPTPEQEDMCRDCGRAHAFGPCPARITVPMSAVILPTPHACERCGVAVYSCRAIYCPACETTLSL